MNPILMLLVGIVCLVLSIQAIWTSSRRVLSFGLAIGAFLLVVVLGLVATLILTPRQGSVVDVNTKLDMVGSAITLAAPIAAVWAAHRPPRRKP